MQNLQSETLIIAHNKKIKLNLINITIIILLFIILHGCYDGYNFNIEKNIISQSCIGFIPGSQIGGINVTVNGMLRYEDKEYNENGFTGITSFKPIRYADIEIISCSDKSVIGSGRSDSDGKYSISFTNLSEPGVYLRVSAQTEPDTTFPNIPNIVIKKKKENNVKDEVIYSITSDAFDDGSKSIFTQDLDATESSLIGGAFNILDNFTTSSDYVRSLSGKDLPLLTVYWQTGSDDGTYFESSDNSIHVVSKSTDTDEYDDNIIIHEFGHFVSTNLSKDDSIGGTHILNDSTQDIRLAWSEGWATFFASAVKGTPIVVDTNAGGASNFNIEIPTYRSTAIYTTNEMAVAYVLWHIFADDGISKIWDIFVNDLPKANEISIEDFWDSFITKYPSYTNKLLDITKDRSMELFLDSSEPDNSISAATNLIVNNNSSHNTLYPIGDKDYFKFTLIKDNTYTIETMGLSNGADTSIQIVDTDGATIKSSNDNRDGKIYSCTIPINCPENDDLTLSSLISYTPTTTGTYYAIVSRSSKAPPSSGVYGSYNILFTSP